MSAFESHADAINDDLKTTDVLGAGFDPSIVIAIITALEKVRKQTKVVRAYPPKKPA